MDIKIPENFPELLKKKRKELGYNQSEFGELLGVSQANISGYETGKFIPTKSVFLHIRYKYPNIFGEEGSLDTTASSMPLSCSPDDQIQTLLDKARIVLESKTQWSEALRPNIEAFYVGLMSNEYNQRKPDNKVKIPKTGDRRKKAG